MGRKGNYYYNKMERIWEGKETTRTITIKWKEFRKERKLLLQ
jgi:hypothetical protein